MFSLREQSLIVTRMLEENGMLDEVYDRLETAEELEKREVLLNNQGRVSLEIIEWKSKKESCEEYVRVEGLVDVSGSITYGYVNEEFYGMKVTYSVHELGEYTVKGVVSFTAIVDHSHNIIKNEWNYAEELTGTVEGKRLADLDCGSREKELFEALYKKYKEGGVCLRS